MTHSNDLLAFMELATDLDATRRRVLEAPTLPELQGLAAEYGYNFSADDFLKARKILLTGRLSWIGHCRLWQGYLQPG